MSGLDPMGHERGLSGTVPCIFIHSTSQSYSLLPRHQQYTVPDTPGACETYNSWSTEVEAGE